MCVLFASLFFFLYTNDDCTQFFNIRSFNWRITGYEPRYDICHQLNPLSKYSKRNFSQLKIGDWVFCGLKSKSSQQLVPSLSDSVKFNWIKVLWKGRSRELPRLLDRGIRCIDGRQWRRSRQDCQWREWTQTAIEFEAHGIKPRSANPCRSNPDMLMMKTTTRSRTSKFLQWPNF